VVSHGPNSSRTDRSRFRLLFDWTGTDDPTPYLAVPRAIAVMGGLLPGGWEALRTHNHQLVLEGRRIVSDAIGAAGLPDAAMLGSMASIPLAPAVRDARGRDPLALALRHRHGIEVPVPAWPQQPKRLLRISAQAYNRIEDYERLAEALIAERVSAA
jgi:isopenicillin-N epimerase